MGEEGNADVLLVHHPAAEATFMEGGFGKERALVMHNDYMIVGPESDPAHTRGLPVLEAFNAMANSTAAFVSRGDDSGTHKAELALWTQAGLDPRTGKPDWYLETGQGMGATLIIASQEAAYTLSDRATYLANRDNLELDVLVEGDKALLNIYHVITVNPEKWPKVNYAGATAFLNFLIDPKTQLVIGTFGTEEFGQPLFTPDADKTDADLDL
jgi:tungstate transport system substrate-binding protein